MVPTRTNGPQSQGGSSGLSKGGGGDVAAVVTNGGGDGGGVGKGVNDHGTHLKKGPWTAEEDAILVEYVGKHGEGNWNAVQRNSGLARCGKSCRLRWANHLRPNLKKGAFSPEEERLIVELHAKFGNKWARMASLLPGRTDNEIKNYWNTRVKRHQRQGLSLYPPDVRPQYSPGHHFPYQQQDHHHPMHTTSMPSFTFQTQLQSPSTSTNSFTHISRSPIHYSHMSPVPTTASAGFSTDNQLRNSLSPRLHHRHYNSTPTTPTSSFSFPTQFQSPTANALIHNTHTHTHPCSHCPTASTPPPVSPHSPTTNAVPTLPLFDMSIPRNPPVLQSPLRFKRFSSTPNLTSIDSSSNNNNTTTTNISSLSNANPYGQFSQPLSPLPSPSASNAISMSLAGLLNSSSNEFHKELQKENQKMRQLYAAVTQPELPSSQFLPPPSQNNINLGSNVAANVNKFDGKLSRSINRFDCEDKGGVQLGLPANGSGILEDLWPEAKAFVESGQNSRKQSRLTLEEEKTETLQIEGFDGHSILLSLSPGLEPNDEAADQLNAMPDELTNLLNTVPPPSMQAEMCADSGDISNGPSSVVTDDHIGFDLQQMASLIPATTDHGRTLGPCSWDKLPRMC